VHGARRRLAGGAALTGTVSLTRPTAAQRLAVERLLGRRPGTGESIGVPLADLDTQLRRSGLQPDGLAAAVEELVGPVTAQAAERAATTVAWAGALCQLSALGPPDGPLARWATDPATTGLVRRLAGSPEPAASLVTDLLSVLAGLPAGGVPLARFAAGTTGDPHALDRGRPLATLALSAIRAGWGDGSALAAGDDTPAQRRRALWDRVGVLVDELSSTVLVLNVPFAAPGGLRRLAAAAGAVGEPLVLTLRQLAREPVGWVASTVFGCENPAVVAAAADLLGPACPPLVCVGGQPTTAALRLLDAAAAARAEIRYHGDFDWGGLRIANLLHERLPWRPWRSTRRRTPPRWRRAGTGRLGGPLAGAPVPARWDPDLAGAMTAAGRRVEEELVLDDLLADLTAAEPDPGGPGQRSVR
jgi:uncharacterized protein (TIGR02679 family)